MSTVAPCARPAATLWGTEKSTFSSFETPWSVVSSDPLVEVLPHVHVGQADPGTEWRADDLLGDDRLEPLHLGQGDVALGAA